MNQLSPSPNDESHLKLLKVFHFILAGFQLLGFLFLIGHYKMMSFIMKQAELKEAQRREEEAKEAVEKVAEEAENSDDSVSAEGAGDADLNVMFDSNAQPFSSDQLMDFFKYFYIFIGLFIVLYIVLNIVSGIKIGQRKWKMFSLIVAGFNCLQMPFGLILGIFTFIVLLRPSVGDLYDRSRP